MPVMEVDVEKADWAVAKNLISIDGPDGSGKSTFAILIADMIRKKVGESNVRVIRPACFKASDLAKKIGLEYAKRDPLIVVHSIQDNDFFLRAMEVNYSSAILPLIKSNHWVVIDSSEIRALAFMLERGSYEAIEDTKKRISTGVLFSGLQPGLRVILSGTPTELMKNLKTKPILDVGDPKNEEAMRLRMYVYDSAIDFIRRQAGAKSKWLNIQIKHSVLSADTFLRQIAKEKIEPILFERLT